MAAPKNDFVPFANGSGANVVDQATWKALPQLSTGFTSGIASSAQMNKAFRQSSIMSAVLAQFIADKTGADVIDDGTTATILANLNAAIIGMIGSQTSGLMSLTNGGTINGQYPTVGFNQTNLSGGAGLWMLQGSNGNFCLIRNTSSSRNFSTFTTPITVDATDIATFIQPPIAPSPAANDNSQNLAPTSWIWGNIRALVQSCIAAVATAAGFQFSKSENGYIAFPSWLGGVIFQWGYKTFTTSGIVTTPTPFPIAFPNACLIVNASNWENGNNNDAPVQIRNPTKTGFTAYCFNAIAGSTGFSYISIGH